MSRYLSMSRAAAVAGAVLVLGMAAISYAQPSIDITRVGRYVCERADGSTSNHNDEREAIENAASRALAEPGRDYFCDPPRIRVRATVPGQSPDDTLVLGYDVGCVRSALAGIAIPFTLDLRRCGLGTDIAGAGCSIAGDPWTVGACVIALGAPPPTNTGMLMIRIESAAGAVEFAAPWSVQ